MFMKFSRVKSPPVDSSGKYKWYKTNRRAEVVSELVSDCDEGDSVSDVPPVVDKGYDSSV